jgi:hypothetical protein
MKNILIIGTNDIASACAIRLYRAGYGICMLGRKISYDLFCFRNFSSTLQLGSKTIENIKALSFADFLFNKTSSLNLSINHYIDFTTQNRQISVLNEDDIQATDFSKFLYCINCDDDLFEKISTKLNLPVISCGDEKMDADYFVETCGTFLGRVKYPFLEFGYETINTEDTFSINSPSEGVFFAEKSAGEFVKKNERIATVGNQEIYSSANGHILGVVNSGIIISKYREIFRLARDPIKYDITEIPVKAFSVSGGVLEAVLFHSNLKDIK